MTRPHVIVIDDDPLFRSLLTAMLRAEFQVSVAVDGAEGYYKALQQPPQLAIIDIQMPGWNGLRTLKAFRANHMLARVPIVIMTSDASAQTLIEAMEAGASDYVIKTALSQDDFLSKVSRLRSYDVDVGADTVLDENVDGYHPSSSNPCLPVMAATGAVAPTELSEDALLRSIAENWD